MKLVNDHDEDLGSELVAAMYALQEDPHFRLFSKTIEEAEAKLIERLCSSRGIDDVEFLRGQIDAFRAVKALPAEVIQREREKSAERNRR